MFSSKIFVPDIQELFESYPQALREFLNFDDISTAAGYLTASVYGLIVAVLLVVYAVSAGTRTIAGDEEAGTLDLIVAHPVSRAGLALQRFASFLVSVVIIAAVFWLGMLALIIPAQLEDISIGRLAAMHVHLVLFAAFFGAVTFAVGAATGRKSLALGMGSGVGVLGYVANGIIPQVDGLEWVENLSPFHWLIGGDPLRNGLQTGACLLMLGLVVVLLAAGSSAFSGRDITV